LVNRTLNGRPPGHRQADAENADFAAKSAEKAPAGPSAEVKNDRDAADLTHLEFPAFNRFSSHRLHSALSRNAH
jgi:hypothetical protein